MNAFVEAMKEVGIFYVATVDGDQARVRPFGAAAEFEGNAYICTNNTKPCYKQMVANPNVEICGTAKDGSWIRFTAKAVRDDRDEARKAMLDDNPSLGGMYKIGDGIFEVLKLENPVGARYSFTAAPVQL